MKLFFGGNILPGVVFPPGVYEGHPILQVVRSVDRAGSEVRPSPSFFPDILCIIPQEHAFDRVSVWIPGLHSSTTHPSSLELW